MSLSTLVSQNSTANGAVMTVHDYNELSDKSGWVYHDVAIPPGKNEYAYNGGYASYYEYVSKPADVYPYHHVWDPASGTPDAAGYWTGVGRGSWVRDYGASAQPDVPQIPSYPDVPGNGGQDPWADGGPGTPGWGNAPFYPEYNRSNAYYVQSAPPRYGPPRPFRSRYRRKFSWKP